MLHLIGNDEILLCLQYDERDVPTNLYHICFCFASRQDGRRFIEGPRQLKANRGRNYILIGTNNVLRLLLTFHYFFL